MAKSTAQLAADTQEKEARKVFDYDAIAERITKLAAEGKQHLWVRQQMQVTLKDTKAAKTVSRKLKAGGFKVDWRRALPNPEQVKDGSYVLIDYEEMVIMWGSENYSVQAVDRDVLTEI